MDNLSRVKELNKRLSEENIQAQETTVLEIIKNVREKGDAALLGYTSKFDKQDIKELEIKISDLSKTGVTETSYLNKIDVKLRQALVKARYRIRQFHLKDKQKDWSYEGTLGERLGARYTPLESVGVYIPAGVAPLISTVLMTVVPAKVAGVKRVVMVSPPPISDAVLAAAELAGVDEVYQVGGAQAVAALAYGTETIKPVDKIVGPGNIYVSLAKKFVFGDAGIDGIYGPSELAILADETAQPKLLAMDMLSQLEHGSGFESTLLVTDSEEIAAKTREEFSQQLAALGKTAEETATIQSSFDNWSAILKVDNLVEGAELINEYAPEHLELQVKAANKDKILAVIKNAGAIFVGHVSCESLGDYIAGPSHCLPTGRTARFSSGLACADFMKKSSIIDFSHVDHRTGAFKDLSNDVATIARAEGLEAHARAMELRQELEIKLEKPPLEREERKRRGRRSRAQKKPLILEEDELEGKPEFPEAEKPEAVEAQETGSQEATEPEETEAGV